ncbi:MAG TPA: bifunctional UDP-N-acetylglucosamine diphosphorylase/glucosamine-1-phosphate N-acetyltransferase GlmU [Atopostipes sp.]|nr:bifunctional UDP-N-acetylglucosamine diphosphorylase/glucosamine-1-phosphate N-acetyltransferase GlmU [Atopostipes sp.]
MQNRYVVVLAAGQGTRMKSKLFKVMHPVMGRPMVGHVVNAAIDADASEVITITGHGAEVVRDYLGEKSQYVFQEEQLGTAHAVMQAKDLLEGKEGTTLVLSGDTPLLRAETLQQLMAFHEEEEAKATILTALADDPFGYGRVIRTEDGLVSKVVEEKDASEDEKKVREINTGTYCFDNQALFQALEKVDNDNAQGEYYLPDVLEILKNDHEKVGAFQLDNMDEALGVNNRVALAEASRIMRERINEQHMTNGVSIIDPNSTYIEIDVEIAKDTVVEPNTYIKGRTTIGEDAFIGLGSVISDSQLADGVEIKQSVIEESIIGKNSDVGPNSHLRTGSVLGESVHIGNYVEVKKSTIGNLSKAGHHTYIGDAEIGVDVNVGCGVVVANYNGITKNKTIIGDNSFIGSNATLVAPVEVGANSFVAAGSTITKEVPASALGIARARQENKEGFHERFFEKK